jgi:hypothetical protein
MNEPISRQQRWPLPEIASVLSAARARRRDYLAQPWTQSAHSEHEREARDDDTLDNSDSTER